MKNVFKNPILINTPMRYLSKVWSNEDVVSTATNFVQDFYVSYSWRESSVGHTYDSSIESKL